MKSLWSGSVNLDRFEELSEDKNTEVLIIGGGIAGILTAWYLQNSGVDCILVEKNRICKETTQNTTAKITYQHGLIYHKIAKSYGIESAQKYLSANKKAFEKYLELCKDIECDLQIKDNYVYALNEKYPLEEELKTLQKMGYNAEFCNTRFLPLKTAGSVKFSEQAQFNPLMFIKSISSNLNIYENTFVREVEGNVAITDKCKIRAKKIIVATHYPFINKYGMYPLKLYQHRSYIIALENAVDVNGMYVDEGGEGFSFRNYKDYLLICSGGNRTGSNCENWEKIRKFAKDNFPDSREKYHWAAQDCMSLDGIPYIGQYSKITPNIFVASGFNKWGITASMVAAQVLCDLVCEKYNEYADLFNPSRSILKPQVFINGAKTLTNFLSLSPKRCSHLGCALKWNDAEHSWDCPCHGSRFTESGRIINNPANEDLS